MKHRLIYFGFFICAGVLAAGLRTGTGQGYSDPIVDSREKGSSRRTVQVQLTNRKTGRVQSHKWVVSGAPGESVKIECHEWTLISLYGYELPGFPKNKFRRVIVVGADEQGFVEPYDYIIRWKNA